MCRSTAAPLMAMAGMAGTAVGVAIAVLKEKADRRSILREAEEELAELDEQAASTADSETTSETTDTDESTSDDDSESDRP